MSKTNFEYLKDICVGNDEALEFIEAAENEYHDIVEKKGQHLQRIEELSEDFDTLKTKCEEDSKYANIINAGIGEINWQSDNLQLQLVMEALDEKMKSIGPLKVLRLLEVRKPVISR